MRGSGLKCPVSLARPVWDAESHRLIASGLGEGDAR